MDDEFQYFNLEYIYISFHRSDWETLRHSPFSIANPVSSFNHNLFKRAIRRPLQPLYETPSILGF